MARHSAPETQKKSNRGRIAAAIGVGALAAGIGISQFGGSETEKAQRTPEPTASAPASVAAPQPTHPSEADNELPQPETPLSEAADTVNRRAALIFKDMIAIRDRDQVPTTTLEVTRSTLSPTSLDATLIRKPGDKPSSVVISFKLKEDDPVFSKDGDALMPEDVPVDAIANKIVVTSASYGIPETLDATDPEHVIATNNVPITNALDAKSFVMEKFDPVLAGMLQ